ncbi:hypothetical protein G6F32_012605 [Rhizopus arrhizus]|nr:hypothetical protein G6F32_012605 [Rhizopus arrhizus]
MAGHRIVQAEYAVEAGRPSVEGGFGRFLGSLFSKKDRESGSDKGICNRRCIYNKDNLTCKTFAEHHTPYWTNSIPKKLRARLDTQESCSDYAENVLREQTATLTTNFQSTTLPHAVDTRSVTPDSVEFTPSNVIYRHDDVEDSRSSPSPTTTLRPPTAKREDDSLASPSPAASASSSRDINARPVVPWVLNDSNVAELFQTFQRKVAALSRANLLQIETSIHEILALSDIFLLFPSQHREQMIDVFFRETLYDIHQSFVQESMDKNIDTTDGFCANVAHIVDSVEQKVRSKDEATALLSRLCIVALLPSTSGYSINLLPKRGLARN